MLRVTKVLCSVALAGIFVGCQSTEDLGGKNSPNVSTMDNTFFKETAIANMTEIQSSQEALNRSQNPHVRQLAQQMIDDHTRAQTQLEQLASSKGAALPTMLDSAHQDMVDDLRKENGTDFDRDYIKDQVKAHEETIAKVKNEADNGNDSDAKMLAQQLLPTLQHHLMMAQQCQNAM